MIFLGERGQAKTRMIRSLTDLLDEWMPIVAGSEINDDPYFPVSHHARVLIAERGDDTPIDADVPVEDAGATTEPTAKRKRDMTIEELQAALEKSRAETRGAFENRALIYSHLCYDPTGVTRLVWLEVDGYAVPKAKTGRRPFAADTPGAVMTAILSKAVPDLEALRPDAPVALVDFPTGRTRQTAPDSSHPAPARCTRRIEISSPRPFSSSSGAGAPAAA